MTDTPASPTRRRFLGLALVAIVGAGCGSDSNDREATSGQSSTDPGILVISPERAAAIIDEDDDRLFILDVRTPEEFAEAHIDGAELIDIQAPGFEEKVGALDRGRQYVLYCRSGNRSERARLLMEDLGFAEVYDVDGGIVAWTDAGLPTVSS